jgi:hypothetical protein
MKKLYLVVSSLLLIAAPSFAADSLRVDLNNGQASLPQCGGTVEAKGGIAAGGEADQVNLIIRGAENCSNFTLENTDKSYKLQQQGSGRGGSYSITAGKLNPGWNQIRFVMNSDSGAHGDQVAVWVDVVGAQQDNDGEQCMDEAKSIAKSKYREANGISPRLATAEFSRTSGSGNLVYEATVTGRAGISKHELSLDSENCSLKGMN